jgi:hypothetical protein
MLLAKPRRFAGDVPIAVFAARLLGARYLVQGVVLSTSSQPPVRLVRTLDLLHALSMLALLGSPRYRKPALLSATVALGLTTLLSVRS